MSFGIWIEPTVTSNFIRINIFHWTSSQRVHTIRTQMELEIETNALRTIQRFMGISKIVRRQLKSNLSIDLTFVKRLSTTHTQTHTRHMTEVFSAFDKLLNIYMENLYLVALKLKQLSWFGYGKWATYRTWRKKIHCTLIPTKPKSGRVELHFNRYRCWLIEGNPILVPRKPPVDKEMAAGKKTCWMKPI